MLRLVPLAVLLLVSALAPVPAGADDSSNAALLSFQRFAREWVGFADKVPARRVRDLSFAIRPTGDRAVPYVGVLRYLEELLDCGPEAADCVVVRSSPITEIFPYQGGRWRH